MDRYIKSLCVFLLITLMSVSYANTSDTLSMFRGNPQHTGVYEETIIKSPVIKWQFKTNGRIFSSPVVYNGRIYFGSADSTLYAVDEQSGEIVWKYKTEGEVNSSPLVYDDLIYIGSMDGYFYALNKNGSLKWRFRTEGEKLFAKVNYCGVPGSTIPDPFDFCLSSPVMYRNTIYFGSGDGNLYALNLSTGEKQWSYKTGDVIHSSPAVYNDKIYFGSWDAYFYCLDALTGNLVWKLGTGTDSNYWVMTGIQSSPAISNNKVYFGCRDGYLYSVTADSGKINWKYNAGGSWVLASASITDSVVYFGTSDSKKFIAANALSGKRKFEITLGAYVYSSSAVCGDNIFVGCYNGSLICVNAITGKINWTFTTEAYNTDPYDILSNFGNMKNVLSFTSKEAFWNSINTCYSVGSVLSSPAVANGCIYFGSVDGYLYALKEDATSSIDLDNTPRDYRLEKNYPNPFNPSTTIRYQLPQTSQVELKIFDSMGREIDTLVNQLQNAGNYSIDFNSQNSGLSSGIYICAFRASGSGKEYTNSIKMLLLK